MSTASLSPRFHRQFNPRKWEKELCADLIPVMRWILSQPGARIVTMGLENIKMPDFVAVLDWRPAAAELTHLEQLCAANPHLRLTEASVVCFEHYSSIEWAGAQAPSTGSQRPAGFWKRLFSR